jgi:hypothetical protein
MNFLNGDTVGGKQMWNTAKWYNIHVRQRPILDYPIHVINFSSNLTNCKILTVYRRIFMLSVCNENEVKYIDLKKKIELKKMTK